MNPTVWRKGPPPSLGWWPASLLRMPDSYRWWDGKSWSTVCWEGLSSRDVAIFAYRKTQNQRHVEWTDRPESWPERSRT